MRNRADWIGSAWPGRSSRTHSISPPGLAARGSALGSAAHPKTPTRCRDGGPVGSPCEPPRPQRALFSGGAPVLLPERRLPRRGRPWPSRGTAQWSLWTRGASFSAAPRRAAAACVGGAAAAQQTRCKMHTARGCPRRSCAARRRAASGRGTPDRPGSGCGGERRAGRGGRRRWHPSLQPRAARKGGGARRACATGAMPRAAAGDGVLGVPLAIAAAREASRTRASALCWRAVRPAARPGSAAASKAARLLAALPEGDQWRAPPEPTIALANLSEGARERAALAAAGRATAQRGRGCAPSPRARPCGARARGQVVGGARALRGGSRGDRARSCRGPRRGGAHGSRAGVRRSGEGDVRALSTRGCRRRRCRPA